MVAAGGAEAVKDFRRREKPALTPWGFAANLATSRGGQQILELIGPNGATC